MTIQGQGARSAFEASEWAPVQDALMQGLVHACNNRVAALGGISQLYEAQLSTGDEGMQQLSGEVEKLRTIMGLFRSVLVGRTARRDPARMGEALQSAAALLAYHLDVRQSHFEAPQESGDVEPVLLWPGDAMRFAVMAYLAAAVGAGKATVEGVIARVGDETVVSVTAPGTVENVTASVEFAALEAAAKRTGGSALCGAGPGEHVVLTLALPGLTKATARV
jgi:hypothetical protein